MHDLEDSFERKIASETLERYLLNKLKTSLDPQKRAMIALVFAGEKPGEEAKFLDENRAKRFEEFLDKSGLEYRMRKSDFHIKFFFTLEEEFFDLLDKQESNISIKSSARFRGLPEPVPEKLERYGRTGLENKFSANREDLISDVEIEGNEHLIELAGFPPTTWDEVQTAIELGEKREEILRQFDRKQDSKLGEKLLEELRSRT